MDNNNRIVQQRRQPTPKGDYQATCEQVAALVHELEQAVGVKSVLPVGIGSPGALSYSCDPVIGHIKNANSTCLNGQPLQQDLQTLLQRPVRLANDADCFTLSEASDGAAAGAASVFGVILGTGVGGGLVVNGQLLAGPTAIAGEWGHSRLPIENLAEFPGPDCYCGRQGCVETWLSGPGMAMDHLNATGQTLTAAQIARQAAAGDTQAEQTLERYTDRLARGLAQVINIVDPEIIVLGGGLSAIASLYERLPQYWPKYVFTDVVKTQLKAPKHGDASGVRGAAWLNPVG